MSRNLLILGAGGHGHVVRETAEEMGVFDKIDFLDDNAEIAIGRLADITDYIKEYKYAFVAIGNNEIRMEWIKKLEVLGCIVPILIHPKAIVSSSAAIKGGTIITLGAIIQRHVIIEKGCIISAGAIIDHDSIIETGTHIDCGAIVKSHCVVGGQRKIESGAIVERENIKK